jgi:hypothetical protein
LQSFSSWCTFVRQRWNILLVRWAPPFGGESDLYRRFASGVFPFFGRDHPLLLLAFWNGCRSLWRLLRAIERVIDGLWLVAALCSHTKLPELPRYMIDGVEIMAASLALLSWSLFMSCSERTPCRSRFSWAANLPTCWMKFTALATATGHAVSARGIWFFKSPAGR